MSTPTKDEAIVREAADLTDLLWKKPSNKIKVAQYPILYL